MAALWSNYVDLRHVRQQNQDLQRPSDRLRLEQAALLEDARQGQRLQAMLGFQQKYIYTTVAAQVYGSSGSDRSHVFYIDKGARDGLKPDMAVITADGIVGKVRDVFPHTAQVLAVNDPTSGAGVILETTRIRGILRGDAAGQLEVVGIMADQRIQPGEKVLTAGGDLIFPRGTAGGRGGEGGARSGSRRVHRHHREAGRASGSPGRGAGDYLDRAALPARAAAGHGRQRDAEGRRVPPRSRTR